MISHSLNRSVGYPHVPPTRRSPEDDGAIARWALYGASQPSMEPSSVVDQGLLHAEADDGAAD